MARPTCCWIAVFNSRMADGTANTEGFTQAEIELPKRCKDHANTDPRKA